MPSDLNNFKHLPFYNIEPIGVITDWFPDTSGLYQLAIYEMRHDATFDLRQIIERDRLYNYSQVIFDKHLIKFAKQRILDWKQNNLTLDSQVVKQKEINDKTKYCIKFPRLCQKTSCALPTAVIPEQYTRLATIYYQGRDENGRTPTDNKVKQSTVKNYTLFDYLEFDSKLQAQNWLQSQHTWFHKFLFLISHTDLHIISKFLPWFGKTLNTRTGLMGYDSEWTDEDFKRLFEIPDDIANEIKALTDNDRKWF